MAEINLEHKKRAIWPWILGLIVLLLLVWLVVEMTDRDEPEVIGGVVSDTAVAVTDTSLTGGAPVAGAVPAPLQQYLSTCRQAEGSQPSAMGAEHEFTTTCLSLLADSMSAVAAQRPMDSQINDQLSTLRQQIASIRESDASSLDHSNRTREAAIAGANALGAMHRAYAGTNAQVETAVGSARNAAQQIQPTEQLLNQNAQVTAFFREAGNALQAMTSTPAV